MLTAGSVQRKTSRASPASNPFGGVPIDLQPRRAARPKTHGGSTVRRVQRSIPLAKPLRWGYHGVAGSAHRRFGGSLRSHNMKLRRVLLAACLLLAVAVAAFAGYIAWLGIDGDRPSVCRGTVANGSL